MPLDNGLDCDISTLVDLERYPIHQPHSERFLDVCDSVFAELSETGAALLRGFLTPAGIRQLRAEASASQGRPALEAGTLRQLYNCEQMTYFLAQACGRSALRHDADPQSAVTVSVTKDGDGLAWHFDDNDYLATLALQMPVMGGALEYVPAPGRRQAERDDDVRQVLAGDRSRVRVMAYRPGDLALLRGRDALHRVTPTRGARERCVAVFSYTTAARRPDVAALM